VLKAVEMNKELNEYLQVELVEGTSEVERRFGIELTDVTIKQLLPSPELQRAVTAQAEATAVQKGVLTLLNCRSKKELDEKLANRVLTQADVSLARDRFLSMSGNLEGVNINRNEIDVKIEGLDPEAMKALTDLARYPAAMAAAAKVSSAKKGGGT
jgi:regulator of protease activity HflC (stomatin/prohibitin superfamily)